MWLNIPSGKLHLNQMLLLAINKLLAYFWPDDGPIIQEELGEIV